MDIEIKDPKSLNPQKAIILNTLDEDKNENELKTKEEAFKQYIFIFSPTFYDSYFYLGFIKAIEKYKVNTASYLSCGLSSLISTFYSKYQTSSLVEWSLFHLNKKIKNSDVVLYSDSWNSLVEHFILGEKRLKDSKKENTILFRDYCSGIFLDRFDYTKTDQLVRSFSSFRFNEAIIIDEIKKHSEAKIIFIRILNEKNTYFKKVDSRLVNIMRKAEFKNVEIKNVRLTKGLDPLNIDNFENYIIEGEVNGKLFIEEFSKSRGIQ